MLFLSGMTYSSLFVLLLLTVAAVAVFYGVIIGILRLMHFQSAYDSTLKKLLWLVASFFTLFFLSYLHYIITGKGFLE